jgi:hypothetical protein
MEQWVEIRHRVLSHELSKRGACLEHGIDWRTPRRIREHTEPPGNRLAEPRRKRKQAEFLPLIHEISEQDRQARKYSGTRRS